MWPSIGSTLWFTREVNQWWGAEHKEQAPGLRWNKVSPYKEGLTTSKEEEWALIAWLH
jgi:hypothetical protein